MSLILLLQSAPPTGSWTGMLLAFGTATAGAGGPAVLDASVAGGSAASATTLTLNHALSASIAGGMRGAERPATLLMARDNRFLLRVDAP